MLKITSRIPAIILLLLGLSFQGNALLFGQGRGTILQNTNMKVQIGRGGISSIVNLNDPYKANPISGQSWSTPSLTYRILEGDWLDIFGGARQLVENPDSSVSIIDYQPGMPQRMETRYTLDGERLLMDITIESVMKWAFTIGDLSISLPVRRPGGSNPEQIFEQSFITHSYISGNGSFLYFTRPSGNPPFLMLIPARGTHLEYSEGSDYFIHSFLSGNSVESGTWRQDHTTREVGAAGTDNSTLRYGFIIRWADSWDHMRDILFEEGLFDIRVVPGMSLPSDLTAKFSVHTKNRIDSITAEFPRQTDIKYLGETRPDHHIYEVSFDKLGENMLTIHYGEGEKTYLEFFSTEPLETLIKKRASFIVNSQQHRDTSLWYNGLFSVYDMKNGILRSPDDTDGFDFWWGYVLTCDDPALCKAPYLAAKNVYFPVDNEIEAVEYYLENFVWDKLQRTDKDDPYPYGIYGVPNWKVARDIDARAGIRSRQLDRMQVWRSYDYPHIFMLYYHMYQVATMYPEKVHYLDADQYLERAFMTARAFFLYPYEIWGEYYKAYEIGCYNELLIEDIIAALEENGRQSDADWLRAEYEKKVKFFIYDNPYPYSSEYSFDRTAFESSHAFARYGAWNKMKPDTNLWYDKTRKLWYSHPVVSTNDALDFMQRQLYAGLTVRGWLETKYYQLGADGSMSYMAKMGGWSILDYGKWFAPDPSPWLQLGYASYLSSWSLMNTGTPESGYGFWAPGKKNDGAMGWAFMSSKHGRAWIRKEYDRGAWMYDGEADLGNGAAIRIAETVLTNDPLFGWIAYGGTIKSGSREYTVVPRDGLRTRFSVITAGQRYSIMFDRDGFINNGEISVDKKLNRVRFAIENRTGDSHNTTITILTTTGRKVTARVDGKVVDVENNGERSFTIPVKVWAESHQAEIIIE